MVQCRCNFHHEYLSKYFNTYDIFLQIHKAFISCITQFGINHYFIIAKQCFKIIYWYFLSLIPQSIICSYSSDCDSHFTFLCLGISITIDMTGLSFLAVTLVPETWLCHLLATWPWASQLIFLNSMFIMHKIL